jgi:glucose/arabinose dehydrogenase
MHLLRTVSVLGATLLLAAACTTGAAGGSPPSAGPSVSADGLRVERAATGLVGPTQMIAGPDGRLWVAQLAGGENAGRGQVVAVDLSSGGQEVLLDGLDKPTGLAWLDRALWIATPTQVLRAAGVPPAQPRVVLDELPNNGRSNGTLTVTPQGQLLFETSGRERDGGAVKGSGALWTVDPDRPRGPPHMLASGLKNAYAHVYDSDERLWTTEVAEPIGGVAAPDEINRVTPGEDYGWPACVGDREPVANFGGDPGRCDRTVRPHATFAPTGATPTSVVLSPFDDGELLVALWNAGRIVAVPLEGGAPTDVLAGLDQPQHLLTDGDTLLLSEHGTGTIWRVRVDG